MKRCIERAEINCPNYPELCDRCGAYREPTNADRIRAMTDEELAGWLADIWDCHDCSEHERLGDNPILKDEQCDMKCEQHCLEWLQQPVKEGADHENA